MNQAQRIGLIQPGIFGKTWADFGAGSGAFTSALLENLGLEGQVYAVDKSLRGLAKHPQITPVQADFTWKLELPPLDGILLANSLHYVRKQAEFLQSLKNYLKPSGCLIVVEYQDRRASPWVPFPLPFERLAQITAGFRVEKLGSTPSSFGGSVYSARLGQIHQT